MTEAARQICACCSRPTEDCAILAEFRELRTPEGRAAVRARYGEELRKRAAERDGGLSPAELERKLDQLGVPTVAIVALRRAEETAAMGHARKYLEASVGPVAVPGLVLVGPTGAGKTVAAAFVFAEFCRGYRWNDQPTRGNAQPAMWAEARALTGISEWRDEHARWLEAMRKAELLVLDDVGDEGTQAGCAALTGLLMRRLDNRRRTVLTSNLLAEVTLPDGTKRRPFTERYGQAVADRLNNSSIRGYLAKEKSMRGKR